MTPNEKTKFKDEAQTRALTVLNPHTETSKRIESDLYGVEYSE